MERVKKMVVEYNDPMTEAKRMDTFENCVATLHEGIISIEDEKTITSYLAQNVVKITSEKFGSLEESIKNTWPTI